MDNAIGKVPEKVDNTLNIQDIVIIKQFIEKGFREKTFSPSEQVVIDKVHKKLTYLINDIITKHKTTTGKITTEGN